MLAGRVGAPGRFAQGNRRELLANGTDKPHRPGENHGPGTPQSTRFTKEDWTNLRAAGERRDLTPGPFVREAAARAAADDAGPGDDGLTPEPIELVKRTFRGVHLLAHLKPQEPAGQTGMKTSGPPPTAPGWPGTRCWGSAKPWRPATNLVAKLSLR